MNRQQKEAFVLSFQQELDSTQGVFLVGCQGLKVAQVTNLRKKLRDQGGSFQVAKVTLIRRAIEKNSALQSWTPYLKNQIGVVFSHDASSAIAKTLQEFAKANQQLSVIAGCVDKAFLSAADFSVFVALPSREVLLAQVCGTLNAPITQFVFVLKMLITRLVFVLKQIENQKVG